MKLNGISIDKESYHSDVTSIYKKESPKAKKEEDGFLGKLGGFFGCGASKDNKKSKWSVCYIYY